MSHGIAGDRLPEGDEKVRAVRGMFDSIAPRYDLLNRLMTFRLDVGWRRRAVAALAVRPGSRVADIACGTGDLCRELIRAGYRPVGCDLSLGMLRSAHTRTGLIQADALRLPLPGGSVTGMTCGFALRNLVDLDEFFRESARIVRPGGRIALLEVAEPSNDLLRRGHSLYFGHVVPRLGGLLSDADAYRYLPRSVAYLPPAERLLGMIRDSGFMAVEQRLLTAGLAQLITATRTRAKAGE
ncbi:MAG: Ubiquinone/menaquinone biosynthesis C-methyltransferase UbiE [Acidimicrobiales bacterium]|nr:MAG: ubiquinone/menaquinone biosynthesis methyltransferase [Actinomycetota bacterium]MBV6509594.1 Ubiquinone/menaquinone biosynthesis C-methyltransferase UbiE [Acidimicrobiales bacterium]RIK06544.1 MAG: ubiquinone biosynthesis methyltransferase UbiE [Acidobacteriota bacterium]